jgi:hypothetical protein
MEPSGAAHVAGAARAARAGGLARLHAEADAVAVEVGGVKKSVENRKKCHIVDCILSTKCLTTSKPSIKVCNILQRG